MFEVAEIVPKRIVFIIIHLDDTSHPLTEASSMLWQVSSHVNFVGSPRTDFCELKDLASSSSPGPRCGGQERYHR